MKRVLLFSLLEFFQLSFCSYLNDFTQLLPSEVMYQVLGNIPIYKKADLFRFIALQSVNTYFNELYHSDGQVLILNKINDSIKSFIARRKFIALINIHRSSNRSNIFGRHLYQSIIASSFSEQYDLFKSTQLWNNHLCYMVYLIRYIIKFGDNGSIKELINNNPYPLSASVLYPHFFVENNNKEEWCWWNDSNKDFEDRNSLVLCIKYHHNPLFEELFKFLIKFNKTDRANKRIDDISNRLLCASIKYNNESIFHTLLYYFYLQFSYSATLPFVKPFGLEREFSDIDQHKQEQLCYENFLHCLLFEAQKYNNESIKLIIERYLKAFFNNRIMYFMSRRAHYTRFKSVSDWIIYKKGP